LINFYQDRLQPVFDNVNIAGQSGGGWWACVAGSLDPRIVVSMPFNGCGEPGVIFSSGARMGWGDGTGCSDGRWGGFPWCGYGEQTWPNFYSLDGWIDQGILSATGEPGSRLYENISAQSDVAGTISLFRNFVDPLNAPFTPAPGFAVRCAACASGSGWPVMVSWYAALKSAVLSSGLVSSENYVGNVVNPEPSEGSSTSIHEVNVFNRRELFAGLWQTAPVGAVNFTGHLR